MEIGRVVISNDGNNDDAADRLLALLQRLTEAVERLAAAQEQSLQSRPRRPEFIEKGPRYD